VSQVLKWALY